MYDDNNFYIPPQEQRRLEKLERKRNFTTTLFRLFAGFRMLIISPLYNIGVLAIVTLLFIVWDYKDELSIISDSFPPLVHTVFDYIISVSIIILAVMIFIVYVLIIGKPRGKRGAKAYENAFFSLELLNSRTIIVLLWRKRKPMTRVFQYVLYSWGVTVEEFRSNKKGIENALDITIHEIEHTNEKSQNKISIVAKNGRPTLSKIDTTDPLFKGGD
jgi:hypothetical protein